MATLATLIVVVMTLMMALRQIGENRRRGIAIDWRKTLVTGLGCIAVTLLAIGGLVWGLQTGREMAGLALFVVVFLAGVTALSIAVNRWRR
jgi:TRAP-type C4-dicarboxylate transport system permease large subunit